MIGKNIESDATEPSRLRNTYLKNPMIGYLNINHFENKVINFREICHQAPIDIICVDETKLDSSYPDSPFHSVREGFIAKRRANLEGNTSETICIEVTICKKKWCIIFVYRLHIRTTKKYSSQN